MKSSQKIVRYGALALLVAMMSGCCLMPWGPGPGGHGGGGGGHYQGGYGGGGYGGGYGGHQG